MGNKDARRYPVISLGAEHLVIGHLLRRNILTYKTPPNNEGYDLICIHPNPRAPRRNNALIRIQVKSRYQTDCDRAFPLKEKSFGAFDYLIIAFLNNGYYYKKYSVREGFKEPVFYTLPLEFLKKHHQTAKSGWERVLTKGLDDEMEPYKNERGFEIIATKLGIPYPGTESN
jgi:hypothetical protein